MSDAQLPTITSDDGTGLDGLPSSLDVQDTKGLPDWYLGIPPKAQQIIALISIGFSRLQIARAYKIGLDAVQRYMDVYCKGRVLSLSPAHRASLQAAILQAKALEAASSIDADSLAEAPARDKAYVAKALFEASDRVQARHQAGSIELTDMDNKLKLRIGR